MAGERNASNHVNEKTFRAYTDDEGTSYARHRPGYHPNFFQRIIEHHTSTGGKLDLVVDIGCGPGTATSEIASFFENAIGMDPSEGMIAAAKNTAAMTGSGNPISYVVSSAEELASKECDIADGSVDLITAATAAHWFDMSRFWPRAARVLRPGGTVALWTGKFGEMHSSVPNAERMNVALKELKERELAPFYELGNILVDDLYVNLEMPWMVAPEFDKSTLYRKEWGTEGNDDAEAEGNEFYTNGQVTITLDLMEKMLATASPVSRWRQANPDKAGTDKDIVKLMRAVVEQYLHEAGVPEGEEVVKGKVAGVLLMLKRKSTA